MWQAPLENRNRGVGFVTEGLRKAYQVMVLLVAITVRQTIGRKENGHPVNMNFGIGNTEVFASGRVLQMEQ